MAFSETLDKWIQRGKHVRRLAYPFAQRKYGRGEAQRAEGAPGTGARAATSAAIADVLHPLVHRNTSRLSGQRFSTVFTGSEFFLRDHIVNGARILPAVCYLEMVRAAVMSSLEPDSARCAGLDLTNVVWIRPVVVARPQAVHVKLFQPESRDEIEFEVCTTGTPESTGEVEILHARGRALLVGVSPAGRAAQRSDLALLRMHCDRSIDAAKCYAAFTTLGVEYGPAHRGLASVQVGAGRDGQDFVLARVQLPECVRRTEGPYVLHPSVLDSALQASVGLTLCADSGMAEPLSSARGGLPFALERLQILAPSPAAGWAYVRPGAAREGGTRSEAALHRLDIDLCDDSGLLCVRLEGFTARPPRTEADGTFPSREWPARLEPAASQSTAPAEAGPDAGIGAERLQLKVLNALVREIAQQLNVTAQDVDAQAELSELGFDSISLTTLGDTLNRSYGLDLSPTIFFEYSTLHGIAGYLAEFHTEPMAQTLAAPDEVSASTAPDARSIPHGAAESVATATHAGRQRRRTVSPGFGKPADESPPEAEPIAIIGMSGSFPGSRDVAGFWDVLKSGRECITEIPAERWDWRAIYGDPQSQAQRTNIRWGGFIAGVEEFDPQFFGIPEQEARWMDPHQRLLLMHGWQAIEDAGYSGQSVSGSRTGVFVGMASSGYGDLIARAPAGSEDYSATAVVSSMGPNRLSYWLNLRGPSEPIETACSSSLVAIHRAVGALRSGECELALVGGINTILTPWAHISFSRAGMLCEDGHCKTFSQDANGYVRGEGVGMLLLKRLSEAQRAGDHIYGLIRGSSVSHAGRSSSLTAPNPQAQAQTIRAAYEQAGMDPRTVTYIEAHGTGTRLGDPIEINGLKSAFAPLRGEDQDARPADGAYCGIGSVKTNIGHLELAAGIAGVIKVLLQMKHRELVSTLHCEPLNPYIDLQGSPFYIVRENRPWEALHDARGQPLPRRAGVSAFGFGGVNAHLIVEEYVAPPTAAARVPATSPAVIVLSARSEEQLRERARQLADAIQTQSLNDADLADVAYTLQVGRDAMAERLAMVVTSTASLVQRLEEFAGNRAHPGAWFRGATKVGRSFLPPAEGSNGRRSPAPSVEAGNYDEVLKAWVNGSAIHWDAHYPTASRPRRLSLPAYPFLRRHYWISTPLEDGAARVADPAMISLPAAVPGEPGVRKVERFLLRLLAQVLKCDPEAIDTSVGFLELGLNSYGLLEVVLGIERALGERMSPTLLFEHINFAELAAHLQAHYAAQLEGLQLEASPSGESQPQLEDGIEPAVFRDFRAGRIPIDEMLTLMRSEQYS